MHSGQVITFCVTKSAYASYNELAAKLCRLHKGRCIRPEEDHQIRVLLETKEAVGIKLTVLDSEAVFLTIEEISPILM